MYYDMGYGWQFVLIVVLMSCQNLDIYQISHFKYDINNNYIKNINLHTI